MRTRSFVSLVAILAVAFTLLAPAAASADGGAGGPYYLAVSTEDFAIVRGGERLTEQQMESTRPRVGDQLFFGEVLYHSNDRGARGTRAGRTAIMCLVGLKMSFTCDGTMFLRGQGELYLRTATSESERFIIAILGGTRDFKAARGDVVARGMSDTKTLYRLRLR